MVWVSMETMHFDIAPTGLVGPNEQFGAHKYTDVKKKRLF